MAVASSLIRQELGMVSAIKSAIKQNKNNPITIVAGSTKIAGVSGARRRTARSASGSEPYTDVILDIKNKKSINLSLKGKVAPSLAGGGMRGIETIVPGLTSKFMKAALKQLLSNGLKSGDKVPDVYAEIDNRIKEKVVIGVQSMGGPIDYMYIGSMTVGSVYDEKKNTLTFTNANLTDSKQYAKNTTLYFRLRSRKEDQRFDPEAEQGGIPKIYSRSPTSGDTAGRIVITDSVPKSAIMVSVK